MMDVGTTGTAVTPVARAVASERSTGRVDAAKLRVESFLLEKWYADVFDGTSVRLFYRARLKLGPLTLGYTGGIEGAGRASSSFVIGGTAVPAEGNGTVAWPALGAQAGLCWAGCRSRTQRLWQRGSGVLEWNPLVLNGQVSGAGLPPASCGYVEKLVTNFGPWQLGLDRLKWGRFCGQRHSLAWIEWEGRNPLRLALLDGLAHPLHQVAATRVCGEDVQLRLGHRRLLVQEPMAEGALRGLPLPERLAGFRFLRGVETKWFALGELELVGGERDEGHAVFEEVVWP